ncbi:flagellar protein FlgN [Brevibacillus sp. SYP-B805]|nr:flagellar protein FlgN [Brevibacillus sp. SYP-B805]
MTDLYETLDNLIHLHQALYTLAAEKKPVLIRGDADALTQITHQEQKLIKAVQTAENTRMELVRELMAERGVTLREGTISELIQSLTSAEEKVRLARYRNDLLEIVTRLRDANDLNQQLLEQSLSFVQMSLDLLTDRPEEDYVYKHPKGLTGNPFAARSFINQKA